MREQELLEVGRDQKMFVTKLCALIAEQTRQ